MKEIYSFQRFTTNTSDNLDFMGNEDQFVRLHAENQDLPQVNIRNNLNLELNGVSDVIFVIKDSEFVGYATLSRDVYGDMELSAAYITPEHRNKGLYKRLVQERIDIARSYGSKAVTIMPTNEYQIPYLTRIGFERMELKDEDNIFFAYKKVL